MKKQLKRLTVALAVVVLVALSEMGADAQVYNVLTLGTNNLRGSTTNTTRTASVNTLGQKKISFFFNAISRTNVVSSTMGTGDNAYVFFEVSPDDTTFYAADTWTIPITATSGATNSLWTNIDSSGWQYVRAYFGNACTNVALTNTTASAIPLPYFYK